MTARGLALAAALLSTGIALLAAAGLGAVHPTATEPRGGTLRVARFDDVDFVDPALAYTQWSWALLYPTCAKLFNYPDRPGAEGALVTPEVVHRFAVSKDGRTYTFELKRTFRFHNGAPVTARSFADAFNRVADPRMRSPATSYMHEIQGADAVAQGAARSISGVRVLAPYRLQIRLTRPVGDLTARLTMLFFCPVLPNTPIEPRGIDTPAGSGPYFVAERIVNQRIVLERNPYYRGDRPANVDRIVYTVGVSQERCVNATEEGEIDLCFGVASLPESAHRLLAERYGVNRTGGRYFVAPVLSSWYFAFNHDRPAFRGPGQIPLKKAINYALDRHALARAFGYLDNRRSDRMLPAALGHAIGRVYPIAGADTETARKWLARATLEPRELVLYAPNTSFGVGVAQVFSFNMRQLGIDVTVKHLDFPALWAKAGTKGEPFDVVFVGWGGDYADAASFFVPLLHGGSLRPAGNTNRSYFDDPAVNARMDAANRLSGEARRNAWADLDADLMRDNPPWAPVLHRNHRLFVSSSVGCVVVHPVYRDDLAAICKR